MGAFGDCTAEELSEGWKCPFEPCRLSQAARPRPHPPPTPELDPDSREDERCNLAAAAAVAVGAAVAVPPLLLVVVTASIEASGTIGADDEGAGGGGETILFLDAPGLRGRGSVLAGLSIEAIAGSGRLVEVVESLGLEGPDDCRCWMGTLGTLHSATPPK